MWLYLLPFPFTDLSDFKRRPALALANLLGDDIILCQITSKFRHDFYSIKISNEDFESGSLKIKSNIRPNKIFTVDESIILYKIETLKN